MTKQIYNGDGFNLTMHEGTPLRVYVLLDLLPEFDDDSIASIVKDRFIIAEALVLDYEFDDIEHPLAQYYSQRNGLNIAERWDLFQSVLEYEDMNPLYEARMNTKRVELPLELPDDIKDESQKKDTSSNGSKNGKNAGENVNSPIKAEA